MSIHVVSLVPNRCGLNASSALSVALAAALMPNALQGADGFPGGQREEHFIESADPLSRLVKFAWAFDNVFHLRASSGCGVTAATLGCMGSWPLLYITEGRSFQGPYPIVFSHSLDEDSDCDLLGRIRAVAARARVTRREKSVSHQFAIFHITPREVSEGTGNIIQDFLDAEVFKGEVVTFIKDWLRTRPHQWHKFYLATNLLARALRLQGYGPTESFELGDGTRISRLGETLVESFANALGACSIAGVSAFLKPSFSLSDWCVFARCMNAYQELMCACGVSKPPADLFNYRSDAFSHIFGKDRSPFGSKLTGAGRGGDFVVVGPNTDMEENFETFRHEVKLDRRVLPCHFASWNAPKGNWPGVTIVKPRNSEKEV